MSQNNMTLIWLVVGLVVIIGAAIGYGFWRANSFSANSCNPPLPEQKVQVGNASFDAEMATTLGEQSCGLSGRTGLDENKGMMFIFSSGGTQNFWMKDMTFAIDMIWISGNKVVGFAPNVPPPAEGTSIFKLKIYTSPSNVDKVLEVASGTAAKYSIKIGDTVTINSTD